MHPELHGGKCKIEREGRRGETLNRFTSNGRDLGGCGRRHGHRLSCRSARRSSAIEKVEVGPSLDFAVSSVCWRILLPAAATATTPATPRQQLALPIQLIQPIFFLKGQKLCHFIKKKRMDS
jgi:hypothetical protein